MRHLHYLQQLGRAEETITCRRRAMERLRRHIGKPLLEATAADLAAWREGLGHLAPGTVAGYVSHAQQFYAWAVGEGLIDESPAARLPVPRLPRMLPRPVSETDLSAAVAGAPPRVRPWLVLAGWAGLRCKEIAYLRREHVRETGPRPVLLIAHDATKGRRERIVPMSSFVAESLAEHGLPARGYVFRRADGQPGPNTPARISQAARYYLHRAGIAVSLHQLRHRFGTQLYAGGHDLRMTQELLGHASPRTTAGYAAWDQSGAAAAIEALPAPGRLKLVGE